MLRGVITMTAQDNIVSIQIKHSTREALVKLKADMRTATGQPVSYDEVLKTLMAAEATDRKCE